MTPQVASGSARSRSGKDSPPSVEELPKKDWEKENWMAAQETETLEKSVRSILTINSNEAEDFSRASGPRRRVFLTDAMDGHDGQWTDTTKSYRA